MTEPARYPLAWPEGKPRRKAQDRARGDFITNGKRASVNEAIHRLQDQIERLGGAYPLLSTNHPLNMSGSLNMTQRPADPGVCAYFSLKGQQVAMPCDTYDEVAQNVLAIANHIEATRRIERYGVSTAAEALQSFMALPAPAGAIAPPRPWWEVFGVIREHATVEAIQALYRVKAKECGGVDDSALLALNLARQSAMVELKAPKGA